MSFEKKPSKLHAKSAAYFYVAEWLADKSNHAKAFDECEFTHAEVSAAYTHIELLAAKLLKEALELDQGTPPSVIQKTKQGKAKPDKEEATAACKRRGFYLNEDNEIHLPNLHFFAEYLQDGYINAEKTIKLIEQLAGLPMATVFPTNVFLTGLKKAIEDWSPDVENEILKTTLALYSADIEPLLFETVLTTESALFGDWFSAILDKYDGHAIELDHLFSFTGGFSDMTRSQCYEKSRQLGGCPAYNMRLCDYAVIANKTIEQRALSNTFTDAIVSRMKYGHLKIYSESDFKDMKNE